ncbi:aminopeptidase P family N-terminal domain-containing protein, partial [Candidatus Bathyarchaeota archaeon]|nr:aminopeptidase P family N-terminal domain-containing protein [Candidatus Bathyarchaeota archaeon]
MNRVDNVRKALITENLDCYLVTDVKNVYYLTGFLDISNATLNMLIPREGDPMLLVTSLSFEAATSQACNCHIEAMTVGESVNNRLLEELKKTSIKSIGY